MSDDELEGTTVSELGDGRLTYDCGEWAGETRQLLAGMIDNAGIAQAWQGPTLTIREEDEESVDRLIDEVLGTAKVALPPEGERVTFDTAEWSVAMQTSVATALAEDDLAYEWDEQGNLAVLATDEEAVSLVLGEITETDDDTISSDDGVALQELLGDVFTSSSKLVKKPRDAAALVTMAGSAELLEHLALPFGFEPHQWKVVVGAVTDLHTVIDVDADSIIDDQVRQAATLVRDTVRAYV